MAVASAAASEGFQIGRVFNRGFSVIGSNFITFVILATLMIVPITLFNYWRFIAPALGINVVPSLWTQGTTAAVVGGMIVGLVLYFVFTSLLQAALMHGTIVTLNGGRASFFQCLGTGIRNALPLSLIGLLAGLGIGLGFLLLIIPGIILALAWSVFAPVRVAENTGIIESLGRSAQLTKGHRGAVFVVKLVVVIIAAALNLAILPIVGIGAMAATATTMPVAYMALSTLVLIIQYMIDAAMAASIYYELRVVKEGVGPEQLAAVFA